MFPNNVYNGPPFPPLSRQCQVAVEVLINEINCHLWYLSSRIYCRILWMRHPSDAKHIQELLEKIISGTRIDRLLWEIMAPLSCLPEQHITSVLEYIYQRCDSPVNAFQPVQYLRAAFFLENLLASRMETMKRLAYDRPSYHHLSNQVMFNSVWAHRPTTSANVAFQNFGPSQTTQPATARPEFAPRQPESAISNLEQMVSDSRYFNVGRPSISQRNNFNSHSTAFNAQIGSIRINFQQNAMLSPPLTPHVDQPLLNHVPDEQPVRRTFNWHQPVIENPSPSPPVTIPTSLNSQNLHDIQTPIAEQHVFDCNSNDFDTKFEIDEKQGIIDFKAQSHTTSPHREIFLSPPITPLIEQRAHSVPIQEDESPASILPCDERNESETPTAIAENPPLPQPIIQLSLLSIPVAKKIYYDMPDLNFSENSKIHRDTPSPPNAPNDLNTTVEAESDPDQRNNFPSDHFLLKQFRANRLQ